MKMLTFAFTIAAVNYMLTVQADTAPVYPLEGSEPVSLTDFSGQPGQPTEDAAARQKRLLIFNIYRGTPSNPNGTPREESDSSLSGNANSIDTSAGTPLFGGYRVSGGGLINPETTNALRVLGRNFRERSRALYQTARSFVGPVITSAVTRLNAARANTGGGSGISSLLGASSNTGTEADSDLGSSSTGNNVAGLGGLRLNPEARDTFRSATSTLSTSIGRLFRSLQLGARNLAGRFRPTTTTESSFWTDFQELNE